MANKVLFGVSNLYVGLYNVAADGTVTLGTPFHVPGTVNISLEAESEENTFYADNVKYYSSYSDNGFSGEIENALFPDEFKTQFMNYVALDNGGIAQIKGMQSKPVYIMFQSEGDQEARRGILYNVSLGQITREYATTEDTIEPGTATLPFTVNGDNGTGIVRASYTPASSAYNTLFTTPPVPALPQAGATSGATGQQTGNGN